MEHRPALRDHRWTTAHLRHCDVCAAPSVSCCATRPTGHRAAAHRRARRPGHADLDRRPDGPPHHRLPRMLAELREKTWHRRARREWHAALFALRAKEVQPPGLYLTLTKIPTLNWACAHEGSRGSSSRPSCPTPTPGQHLTMACSRRAITSRDSEQLSQAHRALDFHLSRHQQLFDVRCAPSCTSTRCALSCPW
jgi:hypothetical protein